jgi:RNA ligase (TIGR02306 family)
MEEEQIETNTESRRKLASIQIVNHVEPHNNADSLELATVLGWQIVTRIDEAKVGELVVYCEIDSVLPKEEWLPEAVKLRMGEANQTRLKTVKLRGQISQGLIIPLVESMPFDITKVTPNDIGRNVTDVLGITKYERPVPVGAAPGKPFPTHIISKTEEERIQSNPKMLDDIAGKPYYATVKCDGTSGTFFIGPKTLVDYNAEPEEKTLIVCSRNQIRLRPDNDEDLAKDPYWSVAEKFKIYEKLQKMDYVAIQAEVCGPNIQKNPMNLKETQLFVFNVVDLRTPGGRVVSYPEFLEITGVLDFQIVPVEEAKDKFEYADIKQLLSKAEGKYPRSKKQREGLVFRTQDCTVSFKVISNKYLIITDQ